MAVDWGQAWQTGGIGFGMVFAVLAILAVAIWLIGLLMMKLDARDKKAATDKVAQETSVASNDKDENNGE